jgi:hypothetical protein
VIQVVSLAGALLLLAAYAANQTGRLSASSLRYSLANLVASAVLAVVAAVERQWGFLLLEGAWCGVSVVATVRLLRAR